MQTKNSTQDDATTPLLEVMQLQKGISRRTSRFLWASLLVPLLLSLLLLYLIYTITNEADSLPIGIQSESDRMARMEQNFALMSDNLVEIQAAMLSINGYMQSISLDIRKLQELGTPLGSIDTNMQKLSNTIGRIDSGISSLDRNTGDLNSTMHTVANTLDQMTRDVNRMSKPRMMFPFD
jgi:methyl-accepting chemotaxis protein